MPYSNASVTLYAVEVHEVTNTSPRNRNYLNSTGGIAGTATAPTGYDPQSWATNAYGNPPSWLTGAELADWLNQLLTNHVNGQIPESLDQVDPKWNPETRKFDLVPKR
jgi:hypothetical protein